LNDYYQDRESLEDAGDWCYSRVHEEQFTWPYVQKQMVKIIEDTLKAKPQSAFKGFGTPARIN
jgi:hypothetical protein